MVLNKQNAVCSHFFGPLGIDAQLFVNRGLCMRDYKSLRVAVMIFVPRWLTHTHTQRHTQTYGQTAFVRLYY